MTILAKEIMVIGLGAGDIKQMSFGVYETVTNATHLYLRTDQHPVVDYLKEKGLAFRCFDDIYEKHDDFETVYEEIVERLYEAADTYESIVYAVPGHPLVAEKTVQLLLTEGTEKGYHVSVQGGHSFIDDMLTAVSVDPIEGFTFTDGATLSYEDINVTHHQFICQVYDSFIASHVKLTLMEFLPDEYEVYICDAVGSAAEKVTKVPLYELDRAMEVSNLTTTYVPKVTDETLRYRTFDKLKEVIQMLRSENGCPWDRAQTHESLKKYLVEETYEVLDAIDEQDDDHLVEELGDVLLQVMLHAQIGEDEGYFTIEDVIEAVTSKMIRRHPHVFGEVHVENEQEVMTNWEAIKKQEKETQPTSLLENIPSQLPSLYRAFEMQKKAAKVGFDWTDPADIWGKLTEEVAEWKEELQAGNKENAEKELGDVLFVLVNLARFYKQDPEEAIRSTNRKFQTRFAYVEQKVMESNRDWTSFTLEELDVFWDEAKKKERES